MATYAPVLLSGSTDGDPIKVAATGTPGTLIHTAVSGSAAWDEVYLDVANTDTSAVDLTIEWGGVTDPDHLILKAVSIPAKSGLITIVAGRRLNNGGVIRAFASSANKLLIVGNVNRIQ